MWQQVTEILQTAGNWLEGKGYIVFFSTILTAIGGWFVFYLHRYFLPKVTAKLLLWITKVVSQMFGVPQEEVSNEVGELPIVRQMKDWNERMVIESELKLIELKNRLVSNKLSTTEKVAYQEEFDYILDKFGHLISARTMEILKKIEDAIENYEVR